MEFKMIFFSLLMLIMNPTYAISKKPNAGPVCPKISLDSHVHNFSGGREADLVIDNKKVGHTFLISDAYRKNKKGSQTGFEINFKSMKITTKKSPCLNFETKLYDIRDIENAKVSKIVSKNPERFTGLCSVDLEWEDSSESLEKCLGFKGMLGLKVHPSWMETPLHKFEKEFEDALKIGSQNGLKFLLVHLHGEETEKSISVLHEKARKYPALKFIVAHSFSDPRLINYLASINKTNNIFLETSTVLNLSDKKIITSSCHKDGCDEVPLVEYTRAYEKFGLDKVIYGSDTWDQGYLISMGINLSRYVNFNDEIHMYEKVFVKESDKILYRNGLKFLKDIRPDVHYKLSNCIDKDGLNKTPQDNFQVIESQKLPSFKKIQYLSMKESTFPSEYRKEILLGHELEPIAGWLREIESFLEEDTPFIIGEAEGFSNMGWNYYDIGAEIDLPNKNKISQAPIQKWVQKNYERPIPGIIYNNGAKVGVFSNEVFERLAGEILKEKGYHKYEEYSGFQAVGFAIDRLFSPSGTFRNTISDWSNYISELNLRTRGAVKMYVNDDNLVVKNINRSISGDEKLQNIYSRLITKKLKELTRKEELNIEVYFIKFEVVNINGEKEVITLPQFRKKFTKGN